MFKNTQNKIKEGVDSVIQKNMTFIMAAMLTIEFIWVSFSDETRLHLFSKFLRLTSGDLQTMAIVLIGLVVIYGLIILALSTFKQGRWLMKTLVIALAWVSLYQLVVMTATRG